MHASPYDSVRIFVETKCKKAIGMHWGESPGPSFLILPLLHHTVVALSGSTALAHMYMPTPHFYRTLRAHASSGGACRLWGLMSLIIFALVIGTWVLTDEPIMEPPVVLKEALKKDGIAEEGIFDVFDIGESREY